MMTRRTLKRISGLLAALLCAGLALNGCGGEEPEQTGSTAATASTSATQRGDSILPTATKPESAAPAYTSVYATVFGDTVVLATVPMEQYAGLEPECDTREISRGGRILCGGEHELETPITRVVILEDLVPRATCGWFRDMVRLEFIQGLEMLHVEYVTDMSYMFTGCEVLTQLNVDDWDVSNAAAMTGIFDGCDALLEKPAWYQAAP